MIILYRPHRGVFLDSMSEVKVFSSTKETCDYIVQELSEFKGFSSIKEMCEYIVHEHKNAFTVSDIVISYYCYDCRTEWETFVVTVKRYYNEKYIVPQAIGFFTMKEGR